MGTLPKNPEAGQLGEGGRRKSRTETAAAPSPRQQEQGRLPAAPLSHRLALPHASGRPPRHVTPGGGRGERAAGRARAGRRVTRGPGHVTLTRRPPSPRGGPLPRGGPSPAAPRRAAPSWERSGRGLPGPMAGDEREPRPAGPGDGGDRGGPGAAGGGERRGGRGTGAAAPPPAAPVMAAGEGPSREPGGGGRESGRGGHVTAGPARRRPAPPSRDAASSLPPPPPPRRVPVTCPPPARPMAPAAAARPP